MPDLVPITALPPTRHQQTTLGKIVSAVDHASQHTPSPDQHGASRYHQLAREALEIAEHRMRHAIAAASTGREE